MLRLIMNLVVEPLILIKNKLLRHLIVRLSVLPLYQHAHPAFR